MQAASGQLVHHNSASDGLVDDSDMASEAMAVQPSTEVAMASMAEAQDSTAVVRDSMAVVRDFTVAGQVSMGVVLASMGAVPVQMPLVVPLVAALAGPRSPKLALNRNHSTSTVSTANK